MIKHGCVKLDRLFRFPSLVSDKHKRRNDPMRYPTVPRQHYLPGKAVFVIQPTVFLAKRIFIQRHKHCPACREFLPQDIHFVPGATRDHKGYSWCESEKRTSGHDGERLT